MVGINRRKDVVSVPGADRLEVQGLLSDEDAARSEYSAEFGKQPVLVLQGGHVMKDGEAGGGRECTRGQVSLGRICDDHLDVGAGKTPPQRFAQSGVDLDRGDLGHPLTKEIRRQPGSWSDFEQVVTEIAGGLYPGKQLALEHFAPLGTGEEFEVGLIHDFICMCRGGWPSQHNRSKKERYRPTLHEGA